MQSWKSSGDPRSPDEEGLARTLEAVVAKTPAEFLKARGLFQEGSVRYVSAVLAGLSQSVRDDTPIDWAATIDLMSWVAMRGGDDSEWRYARLSCIDPSPTVRSAYGQWFPHLLLLDEAWARQHVKSIFPEDQRELRDAAREAYLRRGPVYNLPFELLRQQYHEAVDRLDEMEERDLPRRERAGGALGEHLVILAGRGLVSWSDDDALLRRFFEHAAPQDADRAIWLVGRDLADGDTDLSDDAVERFRRLAEDLLGMLEENGRERMGHFTSLGWWIASGRFDPEWTLDRLARLVELAGGAKPSFGVTDYLVDVSRNHPSEALEVFRMLVNADGLRRGPKHVRSARVILRAALADPSSHDAARSFIEQLLAAGHLDYRDLL